MSSDTGSPATVNEITEEPKEGEATIPEQEESHKDNADSMASPEKSKNLNINSIDATDSSVQDDVPSPESSVIHKSDNVSIKTPDSVEEIHSPLSSVIFSNGEDNISSDLKQSGDSPTVHADSVSVGSAGLPEDSGNINLAGLAQSPSLSSSLSRQLIDSHDDSTLSTSCEMCANYEFRLQQLQETERNQKQQLVAAQSLADRYRTELSGERTFRNEVEGKMTQLSREATKQIEDTSKRLVDLESTLEAQNSQLEEKLLDVGMELKAISEARQKSAEEAESLRKNYEQLLGKNRKEAEELQAEAIDLPQTVDDLHLMVLQLREELIETRAAKKHQEETFTSEVTLLRESLSALKEEKQNLGDNLSEEVNGLRTELGISRSKNSDLQQQTKRTIELEKQIVEYQTTIGDLESKLGSLQKEKGELEFENNEFKKKTTRLQTELDNSEAVQRDFVKLSQNLQIELEKIRQAEKEVRWEDSDDAIVCNGCRQPFSKHRHKHHCRHCGKVFCDSCLPRSVPSGPVRRPAKVCDVCYTLLVRDTAPYFSQHVPESV